MFNKCKEVIALAFTVVVTFAALADRTITEGDFTFNCNDSTMEATLTKYIGSSSRVTSIPTTVSYQTTEYVRDASGNIKYDEDGKAKTKTVTHTYNVTSISYAFNGNTTVKHVAVPSCVKTIPGAFYGCGSLESVDLNDIEVISGSAFGSCTSLTSIAISSYVKTIGDSAFSGCTALKSVTIPSSVTSIGNSAFNGCNALEEIEFPSSLKTLGDSAVANCQRLKRAVINGDNLNLGGSIFFRCAALESAVLGSGVASIAEGSYSMGWFSDTYYGTFSYCTGLKTVDIQTTKLSYIPKYMFWESGVKTVKFAGGVSRVGDSAFYRCESLESIEGEFAPSVIGSLSFYDCKVLRGAIDFSNLTQMSGSAFYGCAALEGDIVLPKLVEVASSAFSGCAALSSVSLPVAETIRSSAFSSCAAMKSITFSSNLRTVESSAFNGCVGLQAIEFPNSLKTLGDSVLAGCTGLKRAVVDGDNLAIGGSLFFRCTGLETVVLGSGVASIAEGSYSMGWTSDTYYGMFSYCSGLKSVDIQTTQIFYIPKYMFWESGVKSVKFAGGVSSVGDSAFYRCESLESIEGEFAPSVIGSLSFYDCKVLRGTIDFSNLTQMSGSAFYGCAALEGDIVLPKLVEVASSAFSGCAALSSVSLPVAETIRSSAFSSCAAMKSITFSSNLRTVESSAFNGCVGLQAIEFPNSLKTLGDSVLAGCTSLKRAVVDGDNLVIGGSLFFRCTGLETVILGSGVASIAEGSYSMGWFSDTYYGTFSYCTGLKTVDIQTTKLSYIPKYMFWESGVKSVKFAGGVSSVGDSAFYRCESLESIEGEFAPSVIGSLSFYDCKVLRGTIDFSNLTQMSGSAFYGCAALEGPLDAPLLTSIPSSAFYQCLALKGAGMPKARNIGSSAFYKCTSLASVRFSPDLTNVASSAFGYCSSIRNVEFGSSLVHLAAGSFSHCTALTNAVFKGGVPNVDGATGSSVAFYNCASGAKGHYPYARIAEWQKVIDPGNKKWQGLIMEEVEDPTLVIKPSGMDWGSGEITLSCQRADGKTLTTDGRTVEVYWSDVTNGVDQTRKLSVLANYGVFRDPEFLTRGDGIHPVYYTVVASDGAMACCRTRGRYGVVVGVTDYLRPGYGDGLNSLPQCGRDAELVHGQLLAVGGFDADNTKCLVGGEQITGLNDVRSNIANLSSKLMPGDYVLLYISTHGGSKDNEPVVYMADAPYGARMMAADVGKLDQSGAAGVAITCIIDACHAAGLYDGDELYNGMADWFLESGLASCSRNVSWVGACLEDEVSWTDGLTTFMFDYGLKQGYAHKNATMLDLSRYAHGILAGTQGVDWQNDNILGKIRFANWTDKGVGVAPAKPEGLSATQGAFSDKITVNWESGANVSFYWVYAEEYADDGGGYVVRKIGTSKTTHFDDVYNEYSSNDMGYYYVRSVNGYGASGLVGPVRGWIEGCDAEFTVRFDANGHGNNDMRSRRIGETIGSLPDQSIHGYRLDGWFTDPKGGTKISPDMKVFCDVTYYAHWVPDYSTFLQTFSMEYWSVSAFAPDGESESLTCSNVPESGSSDGSMVLDEGGTFKFTWKTSCESQDEDGHLRDHAEFLVDGEVVATSDGESTWKQVSVDLSGGKSHTVTWRYVKDGSGSAGEDCVWISEIQFASLADEVSSSDLLDESDYNWFYETTPTAFTESEPFEYNPVLTPENATCQIDIYAAIGEVESSALIEEDVEDAQAAIVKVAGAFGLDYAVLTADGWTMVGNGGLGAEGNDGDKISVVIDYAAKPSKVKYMVSGHTLTNADGVALFECAAQKSSVQALVAKGDGTIDCWAGKYEVVNSDVQFVAEGSEIELAANLDTFPSETFQVTGGGTLVIPSDKIPVGGVNRKLHVDGNSKVRFDLSGSGTIPSVTRLFNGVGGAFVIGDNIQLVVPGEGVERVSKLLVKDGNLEARVAERPTIDDGDGSDSAFTVNAEGDSTAVSASIGNAVEGFWYGLLTTGMLTSDFVLDPDSVKQCTGTGSLRLESSANANSNSGFYRISVSAEKP